MHTLSQSIEVEMMYLEYAYDAAKLEFERDFNLLFILSY